MEINYIFKPTIPENAHGFTKEDIRKEALEFCKSNANGEIITEEEIDITTTWFMTTLKWFHTKYSNR